MLSLADLQHLEAAANWLERGDYCNCLNELERIDSRDDIRVQTLRWKLYEASGMRAAAAEVALRIQGRHPRELVCQIARALSFQNGFVPFFVTLFAW